MLAREVLAFPARFPYGSQVIVKTPRAGRAATAHCLSRGPEGARCPGFFVTGRDQTG
jgi:hypothetical protein